MKKFLVIPTAIILIISSCRKEITGEAASSLTGRWRWIETRDTPITPATQGKEYYIEIKKDGTVEFFENSNSILSRRLYLYRFRKTSSGLMEFAFRTSKKGKIIFSGNLRGPEYDTLYNSDFPYARTAQGLIFNNYLVKEK